MSFGPEKQSDFPGPLVGGDLCVITGTAACHALVRGCTPTIAQIMAVQQSQFSVCTVCKRHIRQYSGTSDTYSHAMTPPQQGQGILDDPGWPADLQQQAPTVG